MTDHLRRVLGFRDLTFIVIGTVIGSGIFMVPGFVLYQSGDYYGIALLVWLFGGLLSLLGAMTYGELGAMFPEAGGLYIYLREAFGPLVAFLYGWASFFIIGTATVATVAVAFSAYLDQIIPLTPVTAKVVSALIVAAVAMINVRGTRQSATVQNWTSAFKVLAILAMSAVLIAKGNGLSGSEARFMPEGFSLSLLTGIGVAMVSVLWAYECWHYVTFSAGETVNPQWTFARGIVTGTAAIIVVYLIANTGYFAALGIPAAAGSESIAADAVGKVMGPGAGKLIAVIILVTMFSAMNGATLTSTRVYYAMANDGIFFRRLSDIHPQFGTPVFSILVSSGITILYAVSGTFEELLTYVVFTGWLFYALAAISVFVFRRRFPDAERPFRVPGYPVTPVLFILATAGIVINTLITQPERAFLGVVIVLIGTPAYYLWRRRAARAV